MQAMSKIKPSPYNVFVDLNKNQQGLLYNSASGELIFLRKRLYQAFKDGALNKLMPGEKVLLQKKGVLCLDSKPQKHLLKHHYQKLQTAGDIATFIVTGTLNCNLNCHYCYQTHARIKRESMSLQTAKNTADFIIRTMQDPAKKTAVVKFYGGEPLLAYDICRAIADPIKAALDKMGKTLLTWIQSNGVLVRKEMFHPPFPDLACVEITIDGPEATHDRVRVGADKKPTYAAIMENIHLLASQGIALQLRINAHSRQEMQAALKDLDANGINRIERLFIYDGQVADSFYDHNIQGIECLGHLENEQQLEMIRGIRSVVKKTHWRNKYQVYPLFHKRSGICSFTREGNYCIGPGGDLYLCLFQIGNAPYKVGCIREDGRPDFLPVYREIMARTPFNGGECEDCGYIAQCWGGCAVKSFAQKGSVAETFCGNMKTAFPHILKTTLWDKSYENITV